MEIIVGFYKLINLFFEIRDFCPAGSPREVFDYGRVANDVDHLLRQGIIVSDRNFEPVLSVLNDIGTKEISDNNWFTQIENLPKHPVVTVKIGWNDTDINVCCDSWK